MRLQRVDGRGSHGRAHVVGVLDAEILNFSDSGAFDPRSATGSTDDAAACSGDCPLRGRRALAAVVQREPVLPLCGGKMGRGQRGRHAGKASIDKGSRHQKRFRHRGAGTVQPQKGNGRAACGEGRADTLVQQIACKQQVNVLIADAKLALGGIESELLQLAFRFFKRFLRKFIVLADKIKIAGQRPFALFFAADGGMGQNDRPGFKQQCLCAGAHDDQLPVRFCC